MMWIGLALTCLLLLRASELFAEENGVSHEVYCLRGGGGGIFPGGAAAEKRARKRGG